MVTSFVSRLIALVVTPGSSFKTFLNLSPSDPFIRLSILKVRQSGNEASQPASLIALIICSSVIAPGQRIEMHIAVLSGLIFAHLIASFFCKVAFNLMASARSLPPRNFKAIPSGDEPPPPHADALFEIVYADTKFANKNHVICLHEIFIWIPS